MVTQGTRWSGERSFGSRDADDDIVERVRDYLEHLLGESKARHTSEICLDLGIDGRTLRSATQKLDGSEISPGDYLVIGTGDSGIYRCESAEEADAGTRRMEAQARKMLERVRRRQEAGAALPRIQGLLL